MKPGLPVPMLKSGWLTGLFMFACSLVSASAAPANHELDLLLEQDTVPAGVVFEIVDWDEQYLSTALPWVSRQITRPRNRDTGLQVAIVSHS